MGITPSKERYKNHEKAKTIFSHCIERTTNIHKTVKSFDDFRVFKDQQDNPEDGHCAKEQVTATLLAVCPTR